MPTNISAARIAGQPIRFEGDKTMQIITSTQLAVPSLQLVLLLILSTLALLIGRLRLALFINYCFTLYWGFLLNIDLFIGPGATMSGYTIVYFGIGVLVIMLVLLGLITHHS
jgi:hypothetical protein